MGRNPLCLFEPERFHVIPAAKGYCLAAFSLLFHVAMKFPGDDQGTLLSKELAPCP